MEILAEEYVFVGVSLPVAIALTLMSVGLIAMIFHDKGEDPGRWIFSCSFIAGLFFFSWHFGSKDEYRLNVDAIVTDWNEVYEEGWTVEGQKGDIVYLSKHVSKEK